MAHEQRSFFRGGFYATVICRPWSVTTNRGNMFCLRLRHTLLKSSETGTRHISWKAGRSVCSRRGTNVRPHGASYVLCQCHWQPNPGQCLTILLVHGLEGSANSQYVLGNSTRAWAAGCNVIRMNMRNCGGTEDLSPTLYHSGLSGDVAAVMQTLARERASAPLRWWATPWVATWS